MLSTRNYSPSLQMHSNDGKRFAVNAEENSQHFSNLKDSQRSIPASFSWAEAYLCAFVGLLSFTAADVSRRDLTA
jgi:hypothetical protein